MNTHVYPRTSIPQASRCQNGVIMSRFATLHQRQNNVSLTTTGFVFIQQH